MIKLMQIGMNTSDLPGSLRLFSEVFGFANAGGQGLWGPMIRVQSLQDSDRAIIWWLLGRQPDVQLEIFHHTSPAQRPLRGDWAPNDRGWVRFGVAVSDFDGVLARLGANGIALLAPPTARDGLRRASFREPYIGCIVEILEDGPGALWSVPGDAALPALIYATSSVADIASARRHYESTLGMTIEEMERLHTPADEASWGLADAQRRGFLAHFGGMRLEIVEYQQPLGRPKPSDYRVSDQGIVNVGFRAGSCEEAATMFDRLAAAGLPCLHRGDGPGIVTGYINAADHEMELIALPDALAELIGFVPQTPFLPAM